MNTSFPSDTNASPLKRVPQARTILVIDNSDDDLTLLKLMFRRSRILNPLESVRTVRDAICYLEGEGIYADRAAYPFPSLVLVDLHLDDGSGLDILRWIKPRNLPTPLAVVVLSGSDLGAFKQAYALGAHSFLVKPLKFADFENMVRHVRGIKLTTTSEGLLLEVDS